MTERAHMIGAVCFKNDISSIDFKFHSSKSRMCFFMIGEDETENERSAVKIIDVFKHRKNTDLFVFSIQSEAEAILANTLQNAGGDDGRPVEIKVRRVNEVRSLILRNLYENGYGEIFSSAVDNGGAEKEINAVILGLGRHGTEMLKALPWFCQMDGYRVRIDAFDTDPMAESRFSSACPELTAFSGKGDIPGESRYELYVHSGVDVDTDAFDRVLKELPPATYVFIALGSDEKNISTAMKLRTLLLQWGLMPRIQAVVEDSEKRSALSDIANYKGQKYDIGFIGDIKTSFSEETVLSSDIEREALARHMRWGKEEDFWRFDYNYKSSMASAIHRRMKSLCGISGIDKAPDDRDERDRWALRILEHRRWNAYMRSEGYVYGKVRNDLAKMHNCLVPFDGLSEADKAKDDD